MIHLSALSTVSYVYTLQYTHTHTHTHTHWLTDARRSAHVSVKMKMIPLPKHTTGNLKMMSSPTILRIAAALLLVKFLSSAEMWLKPWEPRPQSNRRPVPIATSRWTDQLANQNREWCMHQSLCRPFLAHELWTPGQRSKFNTATPPFLLHLRSCHSFLCTIVYKTLHAWIPCGYLSVRVYTMMHNGKPHAYWCIVNLIVLLPILHVHIAIQDQGCDHNI